MHWKIDLVFSLKKKKKEFENVKEKQFSNFSCFLVDIDYITLLLLFLFLDPLKKLLQAKPTTGFIQTEIKLSRISNHIHP
jgi:hypothetical protein